MANSKTNPPEEQNESEASQDPVSLMTDRLHLLATRKDEMWWDMGLLLDEMALRGLALALGFDDHTAYAQSELGIPREEANRYRRVAHHFSRESALRFGAQKLDLLLQYLDATPSTHFVLDLLRVEVSTRIDGLEVSIPFTEVSEEDLQQAIQLAKHRRTTFDRSIPGDVAAERDRLADSLAAKDIDVKVKVHHTATGGDEYSLSLIGIDPFNMTEVGKVLVTEGKALAKAAKAQE